MPERNVKRRLIFHIGCERTGTTSLQNYFARNSKSLLQNDILYPTQNLAFEHNNHIRLASAYMPSDREDAFLRPNADLKTEILTSLMREIAGSENEAVLISAEHFSSRFRLPQIERLATDFAAFDCTVVIVLREHVSRFYSAYATHVASGGCMTLSAFADQILLPDNIYARYAATIALWESVFGKDAIKVCVQSPHRDLFEDFFTTLGLNASGGESACAGRDNKSLGPRRTEVLRRINLLREAIAPPYKVTRGLGRFLQAGIRRCLHLDIGTAWDDEWRLEPNRLKPLLDIARADNRWLEKHYGLRLERHAQTKPPLIIGRASARQRLRAGQQGATLPQSPAR